MIENTEGLYAKIAEMIRLKFIPRHAAQDFRAADILRWFNWNGKEAPGDGKGNKINLDDIRDYVSDFLINSARGVSPLLRHAPGRRGYYSIINRNRTVLTLPTEVSKPLSFVWPIDVNTDEHFPFQNDIIIEAGDIIGVNGESNRGKTALLTNIAVENALRDWWGKVTMWISEWHGSQLQRRLSNYPGAINGDGQPIFNMYKLELTDIVDQIAEEPDNLHILDWVNMKDKFWDIGTLQERIVEVLGNGIAVIAGQKMEHKEHGIGGGWNEFNTSVLMTVSRLGSPENNYNRLKLMKVKSPRNGAQLDRASYRFKVVQNGARIADVAQITDCKTCFGTGEHRKAVCTSCNGEGYTLVYKPVTTLRTGDDW